MSAPFEVGDEVVILSGYQRGTFCKIDARCNADAGVFYVMSKIGWIPYYASELRHLDESKDNHGEPDDSLCPCGHPIWTHEYEAGHNIRNYCDACDSFCKWRLK